MTPRAVPTMTPAEIAEWEREPMAAFGEGAALTAFETLCAIDEYTRWHGEPPLYRELADRLGITTRGAAMRCDRLYAEGMLSREFGRPRTVALTAAARRAIARIPRSAAVPGRDAP